MTVSREIEVFVQQLLDDWATNYEGLVLEVGNSQDEAVMRHEIPKRRGEWVQIRGGIEHTEQIRLTLLQGKVEETEDQLEIKRHHRDFTSVSQYAESAEAALMLGNTHMAITFIQAIRNTVG